MNASLTPVQYTAAFILFFMNAVPAEAQVAGCTDPLATNHDPLAVYNDGSCIYETTAYTPGVHMLLPPEVEETSGLVLWDGGLWTHNDSGNEPVLYKIDTLTGEVVATVQVSNALNRDWEDIAQDVQHIYIGDFGNNPGNRTDLNILILAKEDMQGDTNVIARAEILAFHYEDQKVFQSNMNDHNFDCESMIVHGDSIYLFSKNWANMYTKIYRLPAEAGNYTAELMDSLNADALITGAALDHENGVVALSGYSNFMPLLWLLWDYEGRDFLSGNTRRIDMPGILGSQTEGICFRNPGSVFVSTESTTLVTQQMFAIPVGQWIRPSIAASPGAMEKTEVRINPNPVNNKLYIRINRHTHTEPDVKIFDQMGKACDLGYFIYTRQEEGSKIEVDVAHLPDGFYVVKVQTGPQIHIGKLIKN